MLYFQNENNDSTFPLIAKFAGLVFRKTDLSKDIHWKQNPKSNWQNQRRNLKRVKWNENNRNDTKIEDDVNKKNW